MCYQMSDTETPKSNMREEDCQDCTVSPSYPRLLSDFLKKKKTTPKNPQTKQPKKPQTSNPLSGSMQIYSRLYHKELGNTHVTLDRSTKTGPSYFLLKVFSCIFHQNTVTWLWGFLFSFWFQIQSSVVFSLNAMDKQNWDFKIRLFSNCEVSMWKTNPLINISRAFLMF